MEEASKTLWVRRRNYSLAAALGVILVWMLSLFSEVTDIFGGIGTDGLIYSHFAPELTDSLRAKAFYSEPADRILPMYLAHQLYQQAYAGTDHWKWLPIDGIQLRLSMHIVDVYRILNALYLSIAVLFWTLIFYKKEFAFRTYVLASVLLFVNFMFLKQFFFEPVFPDQFTLMYAILLLYAVLFDHKILRYVLVFCGFFVNKLALIFSALLIQFTGNQPVIFKFKFRSVWLVWISMGVGLACSIYLFFDPLCTESGENPTHWSWYPFSVFFYLLLWGWMFLRAFPSKIELCFRWNPALWVTLGLGSFCFQYLLEHYTTRMGIEMCPEVPNALMGMVLDFFRQAGSRPLGFLSSHLAYSGWLTVLLLVHPELVKKCVTRQPGWIPVLLLITGLMITSETRYLTLLFPFLTYMLVAYSADYRSGLWQSNRFIIIVGLANLGLSRVYVRLNPLDDRLYIHDGQADFNAILYGPLQRYFQNLGPWTGDAAYLNQLCWLMGSVLILLWMYWFHTSSPKPGSR